MHILPNYSVSAYHRPRIHSQVGTLLEVQMIRMERKTVLVQIRGEKILVIKYLPV